MESIVNTTRETAGRDMREIARTLAVRLGRRSDPTSFVAARYERDVQAARILLDAALEMIADHNGHALVKASRLLLDHAYDDTDRHLEILEAAREDLDALIEEAEGQCGRAA